MPSFTQEVTVDVDVDFEVWCEDCGEGICDHVRTQAGGKIHIDCKRHCRARIFSPLSLNCHAALA